MKRRLLLGAGLVLPCLGRTGPAPDVQHLALAWALPDGRQQAGVLRLDWDARRLDIEAAWTLPGRAHGLAADGQGGFYAVAARTGDWLLHVGPDGQARWARQDGPQRFNGHLLLQGAGLFATETDPRDDSAHLALRDAASLQLIERWPLAGRDAHQLVAEPAGRLLVALGGLPRSPDGAKRSGLPISSALLRFDPATGRELRRWRLADPALSLRHLAWSSDGARLGVGLQAEHEDLAQRSRAPLLAVLEGEALRVPAPDGPGRGYAGDICAAPGGGFILSGQKAGLGLLWRPDEPDAWQTMARLTEPCALQPGQVGGEPAVLLVAAHGVARWQAADARMLPWPQALAPDNHALLLTWTTPT